MSEVQFKRFKRNIFISHSPNFRGFGAIAMRIRYMLDMAPRPRIWETNVVTDEKTGDTSFMFQFADGRKPVMLCFTIDDMKEGLERTNLSLIKAGFDPLC